MVELLIILDRGGHGMGEQIHKRLTDEQVKMILDKYGKKELTAKQAIAVLGLGRRQFFAWVERYKEDPERFTVKYGRTQGNRTIGEKKEQHILGELEAERTLIDDPGLPIRFYNYRYIQDQIHKKYDERLSLPTIIDRAKKTAFTFPDRRRRSTTTRSLLAMQVS